MDTTPVSHSFRILLKDIPERASAGIWGYLGGATQSRFESDLEK